jgi:hypothetical protein
MSRSTWPIIVGGCHRSGTSLLRRILNAHSRIFCGPEVKFFQDFYGDYVNDPVRHARFLGSVRGLHPEDEVLEVLGRAYITLLERAAAQAGKPRWADKEPGNVLHLSDWERLLGENWLFVHMVRNPLDTLASIQEANFPFSVPHDLSSRIAFYCRYTQAGLEFTKRHPERSYRVRYEDLVRSPRRTLECLMQALGEELEPGQLQYNAAPHLPGLEDPKVGHTTEVHTNSLGRWSSRLTPDDARSIWDKTRELWAEVDPEMEALRDAQVAPAWVLVQEQAAGDLRSSWPTAGSGPVEAPTAEHDNHPSPPPSSHRRPLRVIALLAVYNEERFLANCLEHLFDQGAEVYLLDNDSTDQTVAIARSYLGRGLLGIEHYPRQGVFRSRLLLQRKEQLAAVLAADWFLHVDADEVHVSPWPGMTLAEALAEVEARGHNAVNFQEFTFSPTQEEPDHDHPDYLKTMRWYYPFLREFPHRLNAWKRQPGPVGLAESGGHQVQFPGLRPCPETFLMRHYLFLSVDHAIRKFVQQSYAPEEVQRGWYGGRAGLKTDDIWLPRQAELHYYHSDAQLRAACPRMEHLLFDASRTPRVSSTRC